MSGGKRVASGMKSTEEAEKDGTSFRIVFVCAHESNREAAATTTERGNLLPRMNVGLWHVQFHGMRELQAWCATMK